MIRDINVKGLAELQKKLDEIPAKIEGNVMRGAMRYAMKPVKDVAELNIQSDTGELAAGLKIYTILKNGVVKSVLAARGSEGYRAMWLEFGTKPHFIKVQEEEKKFNIRRSAKLGVLVRESMTTINRRALQIGSNFVGPVVHHPGAKPHPFLRPALDSEAQNCVLRAGEYIKARLLKKNGIDTSDINLEVQD
jgi:HK97 gp10 family phage protein